MYFHLLKRRVEGTEHDQAGKKKILDVGAMLDISIEQ